MAAPSPRTATYASDALTITVAEPSGSAENDILFFAVQWWKTKGPIVTNPASNGWSTLVTLDSDSEQAVLLYWRRRGSGALTATERTFSITDTGWVEGEIIAVSGCPTSGDPWDDIQTSTQADRAAPDGPSATSSDAERLALVIGWTWSSGGTGGASAPSGYTRTRTGIDAEGVFSATKGVGSGADDPAAFGNISGTDSTVATTVILTPAPSGGDVNSTPGAGTAEATGLAPIMDRGLLGALGSIVAQTFAPLVNPQYARPSADVSDGGWTPSTGADLYAVIDEASRDDGDYIQSATNPSNDTCTIKLAPITLPGTNEGFQFQWAAGAVGATGTVVGSLRQGNSPGTEIASWTHANLPVGSYAEFGDAVTAAQAANITDGSDLYLRIVAS